MALIGYIHGKFVGKVYDVSMFDNIIVTSKKIIVTSKNRKYVNKQTSELATDGWKLKSIHVDLDGNFCATMVK